MRPPVFDVISNGIEIVFGCSITFLGMAIQPFAVQVCTFLFTFIANAEYPEWSIIFLSAPSSWGRWACVYHILCKDIGCQIR